MTGWPSAVPSGCAKMRAPTSAAPPGGNGTMRRIGLFGYCACAAAQTMPSAHAARSFLILVPVARIPGVDHPHQRGEHVLAGPFLPLPRLAHRLRDRLRGDRVDRA